MKRKILTLFACMMFGLGLSLILYPTVSNFINEKNQSRVILEYEQELASMQKNDYERFWRDAETYNQLVQSNFFPDSEEDITGNSDYYSALNVGDSGVMGYLQIPKINLRLPVYHGISDEVLQTSIGHMPQTSLPIGGKNTHAVFSGHRGLPSARIFTDLDQLETGDIFYLYILDRVLAYQVDQILTVEPWDTGSLQIVPKEDYTSLTTCTPYGINTHRLLIRGKRISYDDNPSQKVQVPSDAVQLDALQAFPIFAAPFLLIFIVYILYKIRKSKRRREFTISIRNIRS